MGLRTYSQCGKCRTRFNTSEAGAICPHFGGQFPITSCIDFHAQSPTSQWSGAVPAAPVSLAARTPPARDVIERTDARYLRSESGELPITDADAAAAFALAFGAAASGAFAACAVGCPLRDSQAWRSTSRCSST